MSKNNWNRLFVAPPKSKKRKDEIIFKKKMKKILSKKCSDMTLMEAEADYPSELDYDSPEANKGESTNVAFQETLQEENAMLNIISTIVCENRSSDRKHTLEINDMRKIANRETTSSSDCDLEDLRQLRPVDSTPAKSYVFDPNLSLAKKIINNIKNKDCISTESLPQCGFLAELTSGGGRGRFPKKKGLSKKINYKFSVLEIFDTCKPGKNTSISSVRANIASPGEKKLTKTTEPDESAEPPAQPSEPAAPSLEPKSYRILNLPDCCLLILKPWTKLYFCGKLTARLLRGVVRVLGHQLSAAPTAIYSLPSYSALCLESLAGGQGPLLAADIAAFGVSSSSAHVILETVNTSDSLVFLQPLYNTMTEFVSKHFYSQSHGGDVFSRAKFDENHNPEVFKLLRCTFSTELRKGLFVLNHTWEDVWEYVSKERPEAAGSRNVTLVCGGKNVGKSSMLRYLANRSLEQQGALLLDLDPGQPEFTPAGCVSATRILPPGGPLLGPSFTHLRQPDRSLCLGMISVADNGDHYVECVRELVEYCARDAAYSGMPWLVNTMGFTGAFGLDLLLRILDIVKPTTLVELQSNVARLNFDFALSAKNVNEYRTRALQYSYVHSYEHFSIEPFQNAWLSSNCSLQRALEPRTERLFNVLAYFSQMCTEKSLSVLETVPYTISIDDIAFVFSNICVEYADAPSVVNGMMVALCKGKQSDPEGNTILEPDIEYCFGHGIIRGVDMEKRKLYVITPVKSSDIWQVDTLVYSPSSPRCEELLAGGLPRTCFLPYVTPRAASVEHSYLTRPPKRNFNPFNLLKVKRN